MLKAGYWEDWKYNRTLGGTPQGGIISPLLANIYLHELDKFIADMKAGFDKPKDRVFTPEYMHVAGRVHYISRLLKKEVDPMRIQTLLQEQKVLRAQMLRLPAKSQTDKRINYVRYADDFLIGVIGSKEDCVEIKARIKAFLADKLKLELSDEKTLIIRTAKLQKSQRMKYRTPYRKRLKHVVRLKVGSWLNNASSVAVQIAQATKSTMFTD